MKKDTKKDLTDLDIYQISIEEKKEVLETIENEIKEKKEVLETIEKEIKEGIKIETGDLVNLKIRNNYIFNEKIKYFEKNDKKGRYIEGVDYKTGVKYQILDFDYGKSAVLMRKVLEKKNKSWFLIIIWIIVFILMLLFWFIIISNSNWKSPITNIVNDKTNEVIKLNTETKVNTNTWNILNKNTEIKVNTDNSQIDSLITQNNKFNEDLLFCQESLTLLNTNYKNLQLEYNFLNDKNINLINEKEELKTKIKLIDKIEEKSYFIRIWEKLKNYCDNWDLTNSQKENCLYFLFDNL